MTRTQGLLSLVFLWHVTAMIVGAVPSLDDFGTDTTPPRAANTAVRSHVTAALDRVVIPAVRLHRVIYAVAKPLFRPVAFYLDITDQYSKWNMFSNPGRFSEYVRLDYSFVLPDGTTINDSEMVYPAAAPGEWRLVSAYFGSFVDKAFGNATESYLLRAVRAERHGAAPPVSEMKEDLLPFVRYYSRRRGALLPDGTRLQRTEFWRGKAPAPAPGAELPASTLAARQRALRQLMQPPRTSQRAGGVGTPVEPPSDIIWQLWVVDDAR